jgi:hypothetical protein
MCLILRLVFWRAALPFPASAGTFAFKVKPVEWRDQSPAALSTKKSVIFPYIFPPAPFPTQKPFVK